MPGKTALPASPHHVRASSLSLSTGRLVLVLVAGLSFAPPSRRLRGGTIVGQVFVARSSHDACERVDAAGTELETRPEMETSAEGNEARLRR